MGKGAIGLSDMKATYFPPSIEPGFMGAHAPVKNGYGSMFESGNISYFQNYRNENLSKFQMPPYEWGFITTPYSPRPDISINGKGNNWDRTLRMPRTQISLIDAGRQQEVDNFYKVAQMQRECYKDHTGRLHPVDYFKSAEFMHQCPTDPTSNYFKNPQYYVKYKDPPVLPLTLNRSARSPVLPARALTGRFSPSSDMTYKR